MLPQRVQAAVPQQEGAQVRSLCSARQVLSRGEPRWVLPGRAALPSTPPGPHSSATRGCGRGRHERRADPLTLLRCSASGPAAPGARCLHSRDSGGGTKAGRTPPPPAPRLPRRGERRRRAGAGCASARPGLGSAGSRSAAPSGGERGLAGLRRPSRLVPGFRLPRSVRPEE